MASKTLYAKINEVKIKLSKSPLKKSGFNKFINMAYFELYDFLPTVLILTDQVGLLSGVSFTHELGILRFTDIETGEFIEYTTPIKQVEMKGMNDMQALGAVETYSRRYLYMNALEIVENDVIDGGVEVKKETKIVVPKPEEKVGMELQDSLDEWIAKAAEVEGKTFGEITKTLNEKFDLEDADVVKSIIKKMEEKYK